MSIDSSKLTGKFESVVVGIPKVQCVLQPWVLQQSMMQQTVLLTAVRGPDGIGKYHPCKYLMRWYRRCVLLSAMDGRTIGNPYEINGGSFTGPSFKLADGERIIGHGWTERMDGIVGDYLRSTDELPHHFQMHFMHAAQIVGYKHSESIIRDWWRLVYYRLVNDLHLHPESEVEMNARLGDDRDKWLARNDSATVE